MIGGHERAPQLSAKWMLHTRTHARTHTHTRTHAHTHTHTHTHTSVRRSGAQMEGKCE